MVSAKKWNFKRILRIIITIILVFCAVSMVATKIIYDSVFVRYDTPAPVPEALSAMVASRTLCQFPSGDNLLTGYHYSAPDPETAPGLILLVPGFNAGGDDYLWQIRELLDYGWGVFTFDTTGSLRSQGKSQVGFSQTVLDLESALDYMESGNRLGYGALVLMGHSRGGYAACCVDTREREIAAVVSVSGVNSAMEAVMQQSVSVAGPICYGNYGFLWLYQAMLFGADTLQLKAWESIAGQSAPVLVIHGNRDEKFSADSGSIMAYAEQMPDAPVEFLLWEGGHTDLLYDEDGTADDALISKIHAFLMDHVSS